MREILLKNPHILIIDEEEYTSVMKNRWRVFFNGFTFYAVRTVSLHGHRTTLYMHRELMGLVAKDGKYVDHINRNGLDNRKSNLRIVSPLINTLNRKLQKNNVSGYRGVSWDNRTGKWRAAIQYNRKHKSKGYYNNLLEAAHAYDRAAIKCFGAEAILNFPEVRYVP